MTSAYGVFFFIVRSQHTLQFAELHTQKLDKSLYPPTVYTAENQQEGRNVGKCYYIYLNLGYTLEQGFKDNLI